MSSSPPRRRARQPSLNATDSPTEDIRFDYPPKTSNGSASKSDGTSAVVQHSLLDYSLPLGLIFGGCCTNAWAYEELLMINPRIGVTITFAQMAFITLQLLPSFVSASPPFLVPRRVPLRHWVLQVAIFMGSALLNNWALAFRIPFALQILFRSAGMALSMGLNWGLGVRYARGQVVSVLLVSLGVVLATLSKPSAASKGGALHAPPDPHEYALGIAMLTAALVLTAVQGVVQYAVFEKYGPWWKEGMFYTHLLSLPIFLLFRQDISEGLRSMAGGKSGAGALVPYLILGGNLVSQLACTSGVHQLGSTYRFSPVSTNLVTTARKALSLCFSMWWFGGGWNAQLVFGGFWVFVGSVLYTMASGPKEEKEKKEK